MVTSHGTMVFALDALAAPRTVNSFVFLARYHYYDGIVFHRIIPGFVLQGGDPPVRFGRPGTVSPTSCRRRAVTRSARCHGQRRPNTNGSQFFIISGPDGWAAALYAHFGEIVTGLDVVEKINNVGSRSGTPTEQS